MVAVVILSLLSLGGAEVGSARADEGEKHEILVRDLQVSPARISPGDHVFISAWADNLSSEDVEVVLSPVVADVPFEVVTDEPTDEPLLSRTFRPRESVEFHVEIVIRQTGAYAVGVGGVGPDGFISPATKVIVIESGSERIWLLLGMIATFLSSSLALFLAMALRGSADRHHFYRKRTILTAVGIVAAGGSLWLVSGAYYDWIYVRTGIVDVATVVLLLASVLACVALVANPRWWAAVAAVLPVAWILGFGWRADVPSSAFALAAVLGAGVVASWYVSSALGRRAGSAAVVVTSALWTIGSLSIVKAVILRALYDSDFFV